MITVRSIDRSEFSRVLSFYQETEYKGGLTESDQVVIAERHGKLLAAVRLCEETGELVLRGMWVSTSVQRQGIGTRLLEGLVPFLRDRVCYCLPYRYLKEFYGTIGFVELNPTDAPYPLQERLEHYRTMGLDSIIMARAGEQQRKVYE